MRDPFDGLKDALQPVFHLESTRNGKYIYPEIQQLKHALEHFQPDNKRNFIELLKTIRAALPYIEKWRIDFNTIKTPLDSMAKMLHLPVINWDTYLSNSNASPKFQFSALNHAHENTEFLPWLAEKSAENGLIEKLLALRDHLGFSQKLSEHLQKDPDFLFRLIIQSETSFTQITSTRLVLHLTDKQLAQAIIQHIPALIKSDADLMIQATQLVERLNKILSNGRSISTLMRNTEAKVILDSSADLKIYMNGGRDEAKNPSSEEEEGLKPTF